MVNTARKPLSKFWETQFSLVTDLNLLGIRCGSDTRLEPFKVFKKIENLEGETAIRARRNLALLVQLKRLGLEPSHKNKRYV